MLRYAYVVALAVWTGGMIVLGAIVAPALFQALPAAEPAAGRALAGVAFGTVLERFHLLAYAAGGVVLVTLIAMALLGPRPRNFFIRTGIAAAMLLVALYSGLIVLREIDGIQRQVAQAAPPSVHTALPSSLPAGDARRVRFDQLHRFFANKVSEPDELVQATFMALLKASNQFAGRSSFRTYLFTIARHELYRFLRTLRRERQFEPVLSSIAQIATSAGGKLVRDEEHKRLCATLRTLPVEQQTLLELHYWEELDAPSLAEVFDVPVGTIRVRLHRARVMLRAELDRQLGPALTSSFPFGGRRCERMTELIVRRLCIR